MRNAASEVLGGDVRGFYERQIKALGQQAALVEAGIPVGQTFKRSAKRGVS